MINAPGSVARGTKDAPFQGARVFISYSRKDSQFAHWLRDSLKTLGYEATLDHHDILPGEKWQERLSGLIQAADSVVFSISPNLVASEICKWELGEAARLGKRLLPVISTDTPDSSVPEQLRTLNYIFMREGTERADNLAKLSEAIDTDIEWIRDHTRYGELTQRWSHGNRSRDLLIRGTALAAMREWSRKAAESKPMLTEQIRLFLFESERDEVRRSKRRRRITLLISTLIVISCLVGMGWWFQELLREKLHWQFIMKPTIPTEQREAELRSQPGKAFADCANGCVELIVIPPGTFEMGSVDPRFPRERPQRRVNIGRAFAIAKHELTFAEWDHCVASGHCRDNISTNGWGGGEQPVINVTWNDAKHYVGWMSKVTGRTYRLPTEAEWEYAARAGSSDYFSFGNDDADLKDYDWFAENAGNHAHGVATRLPNRFGLYDMHGNVSEWTEDCVNDNYQKAPTDGSAWLTGNCLAHVFRGGSWLYGARVARSANRDWLIGDQRKNYIGIRVVRELK